MAQFESGAALLYLHDRFELGGAGGDDGGGSAADAAARRGRAAAWVLFANSTMGNGIFLEHFRAKEMPGIMGARPLMTDVSASHRDHVSSAAVLSPKMPCADGLERVLSAQRYLEPDGFSVADVAVGGLLLYVPLMFPQLSLEAWPAVTGYCARLSARRAYVATLGARIAGARDGSAPPPPPTRGGKPAAAATA